MDLNQQDALRMATTLIKQAEGLRLRPYLCPAGVPTIGYGSTRYANGKAVTLKDAAITQPQADELLLLTLKRDYLPGVLKASPGLAERPGVLAAVVDFAYNLGVMRYEGSTFRKKVDAQDWDGAKRELAKWVFGGGKALPGLVARREAEAKLMEA